MNIWKRSWFEWRHPFRTCRAFWDNIRWSFQRVRRGWCEMDTWNLDNTLCEYLSGTLHYLADNTHGWPDAHYSTSEAWQLAMHDAANKIANAAESLDLERNPYLDAMHHIWKMSEDEKEKCKVYVEDITTKWLNWERERETWRAGQKDEAMAWITKYFYHLWD